MGNTEPKYEDTVVSALTHVIEVLQPLEEDDRKRVLAAALVMLGMVDVDSLIGEWRSSESPDEPADDPEEQ